MKVLPGALHPVDGVVDDPGRINATLPVAQPDNNETTGTVPQAGGAPRNPPPFAAGPPAASDPTLGRHPGFLVVYRSANQGTPRPAAPGLAAALA